MSDAVHKVMFWLPDEVTCEEANRRIPDAKLREIILKRRGYRRVIETDMYVRSEPR